MLVFERSFNYWIEMYDENSKNQPQLKKSSTRTSKTANFNLNKKIENILSAPLLEDFPF